LIFVFNSKILSNHSYGSLNAMIFNIHSIQDISKVSSKHETAGVSFFQNNFFIILLNKHKFILLLI